MFSKRPIRTLAPKDQIPKWVSGLLYFQQEGTRSGQRPLAMRYLLLSHLGFPPGNAVLTDGKRKYWLAAPAGNAPRSTQKLGTGTMPKSKISAICSRVS